MVEWTDVERKAVLSLWKKIDIKEIGPLAMRRLLIVCPWTQRHFANFGNLSSATAIMNNEKVAEHGTTVMGGLNRAIENMDNIKAAYRDLSKMHSEKLHVDPDNFRLLSECITLCMAAKFGPTEFTAQMQEAWQKFLMAVTSALGRQYH
ncbi:hemoglobin anodic subunit beta-like [Conger conger]|uniref:hemoglobin anodic subunit beta-like n=1 Tax=Conger conger TaxID=82655 RepID=UPI002A5A0A01|nr:hemoglobin anodic subunit beta-like [Conger conger]